MKKSPMKILRAGGVGVLATDTFYGLVASALMPQAVERVYKLKGRKLDKPCIILISSLSDLRKFKIRPNKQTLTPLKQLWPGKISVILPLIGPSEKFAYLHRGTKTLAFRLPAPLKLRNLIKQTGPLIAPSANPEGEKPARTIEAAKKYFDEQVDFYLPSKAGQYSGQASTLVAIQSNKIMIIRPGAGKLTNVKF